MSADIQIIITSPRGGRTRLDLNPNQMAQIIDRMNGTDAFSTWLRSRIIPHTLPKETHHDQ